MWIPSGTLNTESMVKQKLNTLVLFVTYLHTCMHAEPDRSIFLIILQIIVHVNSDFITLHLAFFTYTFTYVFGMQSFFHLSKSQDAMVLQTCHEK